MDTPTHIWHATAQPRPDDSALTSAPSFVLGNAGSSGGSSAPTLAATAVLKTNTWVKPNQTSHWNVQRQGFMGVNPTLPDSPTIGNSRTIGNSPQIADSPTLGSAPRFRAGDAGSGKRASDNRAPSPSYVQQQKTAESVGIPSIADRALDSSHRKDPFDSLMTVDQDRMDAALDVIIQDYKRLVGDRAMQSVGFLNVPDVDKYLTVMRRELPILAEPNITGDKLIILGLARVGEYYPVLDELETTYTLNNPLSRKPSNAGKWYKVQTSSAQVGWVLAQPTGMGSRAFAQVAGRPANNTNTGGETLGFLIVLGLIVLGLAKLFGSSPSGAWSGGGSASVGSELDSNAASQHADEARFGSSQDSADGDTSDDNIDEADKDSLSDINFSIRIIDEEGEPIEGVTVRVWYKFGAWGAIPWYPDKAETDEDGWAQFSKTAPVSKLMNGGIDIDVKVRSSELAEDLRVEDGDTLSYTMDRSDT